MTNIIAICGPSAAGKDSLAIELSSALGKNGGRIISNTTRPPRVEEIDGVHYHFCTEKEFIGDGRLSNYLEISEFNGWKYGTPLSSLKYFINIGVFNPEGIKNINKNKELNILIVYLKENTLIRLWRSIKREKGFKLEYVRRAIKDNKDFKEFEEYLTTIDNYVILEDIDGPTKKAEKILEYVKAFYVF